MSSTNDRTGDGERQRGGLSPLRWSWRREAPLLAIPLGMLLASAVAWPFADDEIPVHWNAAGEVDRYGGKAEALLLMPALALGVWALLAFLPRLDPGRRNYDSFGGAYFLTRVGVLAFFALVHALTIAAALGAGIDLYFVFPVGLGLLFILLGNLMPKFRPNFFAGIRTPWTLSSAKAWTATHRVGGRLFMLIGVLFMGALFIREGWYIGAVVAVIVLSTVAMFVHSYLVWRDDPERVPVGMVAPSDEA